MITATLDRFGRIVIPRALRQRHGWRSGTVLAIEDGPQGLAVTASVTEPAAPAGWAWRDGMLVCTASADGDLTDIGAQRDALDAERDRDLGGMA